MTSAARPSVRPSTRVNSQRARAGSNAVIPAVRANSMTVASVCGAGAAIRRRCHPRSKSASGTQRSGPSFSGGSASTLRNPGARRVARSMRSVSTSQSG